MKYRAFYTTYSTNDSVDPSDAIPVGPSDLVDCLKKYLRHNQDFYGVTDQHDGTLQVMRGNADRVWLEIPSVKRNGSFGKHMLIDEAQQVLAKLSGSISDVLERSLIPDLQFVGWESETEKVPLAIPMNQIRPLAEDRGACFATDLVTRSDRGVHFMYREEPDFEADSGWRFFAGTETQDYLDQASNTAIYDVNVIANYEPKIISRLDAEVGSAFETDDDGEFVETEF